MKFDKFTHTRTVVSVKFVSGADSERILRDLEREDGCLIIDPKYVEVLSMVLTETKHTRVTPEHIRLRMAAARAAREAKSLVYANGPDARD